MISYQEITASVPREPSHPWRVVFLPRLTTAPFLSKEYDDWERENWWMVDYSVLKVDKPRAKELALRLDQLFKQNPDDPATKKIIGELRSLKVSEPKTPLEQWTSSAYSIASYCGDHKVFKTIEGRLSRYKGSILEAMCGHLSYFESGDVTALDYCEVSLERYSHPHRRRICCDLNQVKDGDSLYFFENGSFDVVSICFGFKYPDDLRSLVKDFLRIIKRGGVLSFVENPTHQYANLVRRPFNPTTMMKEFEGLQFQKVQITHIPTEKKVAIEDDKFWHVEIIK